MTSCQEKFTYTIQQQDQASQLHIIGGVVSSISIVINVCTFLVMLKHPKLRQKNICSLVLCLYNTAECLLSLVAIIHIEYYGTLIPNVRQCRFFLLIGQVMSIGFILVRRINVSSHTGTSVRDIIGNPSVEKQKKFLLGLNFLGFIVNILLTLFLVNHSIKVIAILVTLDLVLYLYLLIKLSILGKSMQGNGNAVPNMCKKAITYVSILLLGFLLELSITLFTRAKMKEQLTANCSPKLDATTMMP